ncbi:hypothetical protein A6P39_000055 [Streptomyces sp. FXJ1.172]|uniref:hypothetical protein n=1 Tax=Streptomyces sp. FXJ1.172 TaxID=710705 RepID=UPI0007CF6907|nr:hypothetical protein [Streptomyces sp. FXJ1.172]WEO92653.1 hypothetical protein A6P39_000055 [Streptomyces sp. FXJ1.172]
MATGGRVGTTLPDAFTGGYDVVYQVINENRSSRSFTVAFAAFNDAGRASLLHIPNWAPWGGDVKQGYGGASVYQTYYWTMEVG